MPHNVFCNDYGIVDNQTNGNRHCAQRHQVERLSKHSHHEHGDGECQWNSRGADGRDAEMLQEQQQDDYRKRGANKHGIAHRRYRIAHQRCLIVHRRKANARRQRG